MIASADRVELGVAARERPSTRAGIRGHRLRGVIDHLGVLGRDRAGSAPPARAPGCDSQAHRSRWTPRRQLRRHPPRSTRVLREYGCPAGARRDRRSAAQLPAASACARCRCARRRGHSGNSVRQHHPAPAAIGGHARSVTTVARRRFLAESVIQSLEQYRREKRAHRELSGSRPSRTQPSWAPWELPPRTVVVLSGSVRARETVYLARLYCQVELVARAGSSEALHETGDGDRRSGPHAGCAVGSRAARRSSVVTVPVGIINHPPSPVASARARPLRCGGTNGARQARRRQSRPPRASRVRRGSGARRRPP